MMNTVMALPRYEKLKPALDLEREVLSFWEREKVFAQSLAQRRGSPAFIFYEGPPTANGKPHFGHLMPRVYKDLFPRYQTMKGHYVERKGGWDTHGLPVELEVEKALQLNSKRDIEAYGIEKFAQKCKESVWTYKAEWEKLIQRMGFWIDLENAYVTYTDEYIESVWWALHEIWRRGLLYKGYRVLPYCPRCGTPLSSHEQNYPGAYQDVTEPAVTVKFKLEGRANEYVLAWTTTPWTLPGNVALAVGADIDYLKVRQGQEAYYVAAARADSVLRGSYEVVERLKGRQMHGWPYEPVLPYLRATLEADPPKAWYVAATEGMVSTEEGTGVVHTAVMYGEEDYELGEVLGLPKRHTVDLNGRFTEDVTPWAGKFVKEADPLIIAHLRERGLLYRSEDYRHAYPFCWRCKTPLLYYATESWLIRTTARQAEIIRNNRAIQWHPEYMRDGRFGNFLETMKDWALSRNRFWGTPLPIWVCGACGVEVCIGSRRELVERARDPQQAQQVELHRPYVDELELKCKDCTDTMRRVPYVIDCWFDSGMMHTAQRHFPFEQQSRFRQQFPADFICEGMDQTRGWFYSLLVTSTLLYSPDDQESACPTPYPHPYRNVIVTGMGLDREDKKMSKSVGNVLDPWDLIGVWGADALRWYFYTSSAPWKDKRLSQEDVGEARGAIEMVRNVYSFFALYAAIDGFDPEAHRVLAVGRSLLDRWVLSRLQGTIASVTAALDSYDVVEATRVISEFIDDLSNWYVRNSRARFWGGQWTVEKEAAYRTLYDVLRDLAKLLAPFLPFTAEAIYRNLAEQPLSVHLCDWPSMQTALRDVALERAMERARRVVAAGLQARNLARIKVRQPLRVAAVFRSEDGAPLGEEYIALVAQELNVKRVEFIAPAQDEAAPRHRSMVPRFDCDKAALGPLFRARARSVLAALEQLNASDPAERATRARELATTGRLKLPTADGDAVELLRDTHVKVTWQPREGFVQGVSGGVTVVLDTQIDAALREEGHIREFVRLLQECRKEAGFEISDRIYIYYDADRDLAPALHRYESHIQSETLAVALRAGEGPAEFHKELQVNGLRVRVGLQRAAPSDLTSPPLR